MSKVVPNPYLFNKIYIHSTLVPEIYAQFTFHFQFEPLNNATCFNTEVFA